MTALVPNTQFTPTRAEDMKPLFDLRMCGFKQTIGNKCKITPLRVIPTLRGNCEEGRAHVLAY